MVRSSNPAWPRRLGSEDTSQPTLHVDGLAMGASKISLSAFGGTVTCEKDSGSCAVGVLEIWEAD